MNTIDIQTLQTQPEGQQFHKEVHKQVHKEVHKEILERLPDEYLTY